ncbi:MAG: hypothetical protein AAFR27_08555, partial [Pseudomonadota bacterium]
MSGSQAAYQRDVLLDQTLQATISQMRADRSTVKARIVGRYDANQLEYTLQMALSDLADYERAGTLSSALSSISGTASEQRVQ